MEALLNLDNVACSNNSLRVLYDKVESHTRELKALGVPEEAYNCLLPSLLMKKLPRELALSISRKVSEDNWNLTNIMKELGDEIKARERTYEKNGANEHVKGRDNGYRRSREPPTATALLTQASHCCYCDGSHPAEACARISNIEERKQYLRNYGRCFNCLKQGHLSRKCKSNNRCKQCNGRAYASREVVKRSRREIQTLQGLVHLIQQPLLSSQLPS